MLEVLEYEATHLPVPGTLTHFSFSLHFIFNDCFALLLAFPSFLSNMYGSNTVRQISLPTCRMKHTCRCACRYQVPV